MPTSKFTFVNNFTGLISYCRSFGLNRFGASGPYKEVYEKFEFTPEGITKRALATIYFWKEVKPIRSPVNRAFTQLI